MLINPNIKDELIYLAQPYSHPAESVRLERFYQGMAAATQLAKEGKPVFAPITHWHEAAVRYELPTSIDFWETQCLSLLSHATKLYVYQLKDWEISKGLFVEISTAFELNIPVYVFDGLDAHVLNPKLVYTKNLIKEMEANGCYNPKRGTGRDNISPVVEG